MSVLSHTDISAFQLDKNFRNNLTPIIKELCHASIEYNIDDLVETKTSEYNELVNCLVNESLEQSTAYFNRKGTEKTSETAKKNLTFKKFKQNNTETCKEKRFTIGQVQSAQQEAFGDSKGFKSMCREQAGFASESFSACQLAETLMVEWCGYNVYATAKSNDFESFRTESFTQNNSVTPNTQTNQQLYQIQNNFKNAQSNYNQNINATRTALIETIEFVRQYQKNIHQQTWWHVLYREFESINKQMQILAKPLFTFTRFINSTAP